MLSDAVIVLDALAPYPPHTMAQRRVVDQSLQAVPPLNIVRGKKPILAMTHNVDIRSDR
jgi:hypothetical protein